MKLKILLLSGFLLFANLSKGQALWILIFGDKLSTENFQVGMNFALGISDINGISSTKLRYGFAFGGYGELRINDKWSFQPELTLKTPAGCKNFPDVVIQDQSIDTIFSSYSTERELSYISMPLLLKYKTKRFGVGAGPQVGLIVRAHDRFFGTGNNGLELTLQENNKEIYHPLDFGLTGLLEFYLKPEEKMKSMRISTKYYYGLINILKEPGDNKIYNSYLIIAFSLPVVGKSGVKDLKNED